MTVKERQRLAARWISAVGTRIPVFVHVGHNCQAEAINLARHAQNIGASVIAAMAPFYYKPDSLENLVDFLTPVAASAPDLPFLYYDIPTWTGVKTQTEKLLALGYERIPTLRGIKFSNHDLITFQSCIRQNDRAFEILCGLDELLLSALIHGGRGAVGATFNFAAPVFHRLIESFEACDLKRAGLEQYRVVEMVGLLNRYGLLRAGKALMALLGVDCGPVRPPLQPMRIEDARVLYGRLKTMDVLSNPL